MMDNGSIAVAFELETYRRIELASAILLSVLSPVTVLSNLLLLTAIYKDPLRCFRTPITFFIVGLALADFLTGLTVEPLFVFYYVSKYLDANGDPGNAYDVLYLIGGKISTIAISTSFFVVLALSLSQYIAISYPHQYKHIVSRGRVVTCLVISCVYFTIFSLLQLAGINERIYITIDLVLHATLISIILIIVHGLLYSSFQQHLVRSKSFRNHKKPAQPADLTNADERRRYRRKRSQRQFTVLTFYLAGILLASASFHTLAIYVFLFYEVGSDAEKINIAITLRLSDLMLFTKVAVDCFIYAWRLPNYRRALKITLMQIRGSVYNNTDRGNTAPDQPPSCRQYNNHRRTVSSFVNLPQLRMPGTEQKMPSTD